MAVRVVIADPNALVRSLLRTALQHDDFVAVGEADDVRGLLRRCAVAAPDVVVTNSDLRDGPIDDHLHLLAHPGARVLVLTSDPSPERVTTLLGAGVAGYLLREVEPSQVADAVRSVAAGEVVLHPAIACTVVDQWRRLRAGGPARVARPSLTPRELEVLRAMADGLGAKAIARRLGVAVKTVENHKTRVFDKLGVRTQAHAVATAISHGLLAPTALAGSA